MTKPDIDCTECDNQLYTVGYAEGYKAGLEIAAEIVNECASRRMSARHACSVIRDEIGKR